MKRSKDEKLHDDKIAEAIQKDRLSLQKQLDKLAGSEKKLRVLINSIGYPEPRVRAADFETLLHIIVSQQLSTGVTKVIWGRLERQCIGIINPEVVLQLSYDELRACGLSARKVEYAKELAQAIVDGDLNFLFLESVSLQDAIKELVKLKGIGIWSAEIFSMFALRHADIFPAEDLALRVAVQRYERLDQRQNASQIRQIAERWSPYRSAMSLMMWKFYGSTTLD